MPRRSRPTFVNEFLGLNVNDSENAVPANQAIVADNVIIESGRVETRPGRRELSEDQFFAKPSLGLFNYTPPTEQLRSIILVRPDGIFQRIG